MNNFDEVSSDILNEIRKVKYVEFEKELIRKDILFNLSILLETEKSYNQGINILMGREMKKKTNVLKIERK